MKRPAASKGPQPCKRPAKASTLDLELESTSDAALAGPECFLCSAKHGVTDDPARARAKLSESNKSKTLVRGSGWEMKAELFLASFSEEQRSRMRYTLVHGPEGAAGPAFVRVFDPDSEFGPTQRFRSGDKPEVPELYIRTVTEGFEFDSYVGGRRIGEPITLQTFRVKSQSIGTEAAYSICKACIIHRQEGASWFKVVDLRDELVELVANELLGGASRQLSRYDGPHLSLRAGLLPVELAGRGLAVCSLEPSEIASAPPSGGSALSAGDGDWRRQMFQCSGRVTPQEFFHMVQRQMRTASPVIKVEFTDMVLEEPFVEAYGAKDAVMKGLARFDDNGEITKAKIEVHISSLKVHLDPASEVFPLSGMSTTWSSDPLPAAPDALKFAPCTPPWGWFGMERMPPSTPVGQPRTPT